MVNEDFCQFELSKLLKENGFDCGCNCYYEHFSSNITQYSGMVVECDNSKWQKG